MKECPKCGACAEDVAERCVDDTWPLDPGLPGSLVLDGTYQLVRRLGAGGMGTVYKARHLGLERMLALKLIRPGKSEDGLAQVRFRREARALGRLKHPGIVDVTDYGIDERDGGVPFLVMEHLEGQPLDVRLRDGPLEPEQAVLLTEQLGAALDFAHGHGVLHRDMKPANVFLASGPNGQPQARLVDFGIARLVEESAHPTAPESVGLTPELFARLGAMETTDSTASAPETVDVGATTDIKTAPSGTAPSGNTPSTSPDTDGGDLTAAGAIAGTPAFMPPELIRGGRASAASDVYSLGVTIYQALTGRLPFVGNVLDILRGHLHDDPEPASTVLPGLPPELDEPLARCLAKTPDKRPATAGAFAASLKDALLRARRREWQERERPRRLRLAAAGLAALAALAALAGQSGTPRAAERRLTDAAFALRSGPAPDPRLVLVLVDEASVEVDPLLLTTNTGPDFAGVLEQVFAAGARGVALDFLLPAAWGRTEEVSRLLVQRADGLVLGVQSRADGRTPGVEVAEGLTSVVLGPERVSSLFAFVNLEEDADGSVRQARSRYVDREGATRASWPAAVARLAAGGQPPPSPDLFWLDLALDVPGWPAISWRDLQRVAERSPERLKDKVVLVGASYSGSGDDLQRLAGPTGTRLVPGVAIHALAAHTILAGVPVRETGTAARRAVLVLAVLAAAGLGAWLLLTPDARRVAPWAAGAAAAGIAVWLVAFAAAGVIGPLVVPAVVFAAAMLAASLGRRYLPPYPQGGDS